MPDCRIKKYTLNTKKKKGVEGALLNHYNNELILTSKKNTSFNKLPISTDHRYKIQSQVQKDITT